MNCEVCFSDNLIPVLDLGGIPLCDDLIPIGDNRESINYPIEILFCDVCKTAHQKYTVDQTTLFPTEYHYRARMTPSVLSGMEDLVNSVLDSLGSLKGKKVLDVGCNDGSLLNKFLAHDAETFGVEPTGAYLDSTHDIYNDFFSTKLAEHILNEKGQFDIITFTNVFAHIENLPDILNAVDILLKKDGLLVVENHYLGAVLDTGQFDTFYQEHPRTYSEESFRYIAKSLDRKLVKLQYVSRYGGNIRVFISSVGDEVAKNRSEDDFIDQFRLLNQDLIQWREKKFNQISDLVNQFGPIPAKAFPGRAAILIKLLGLDVKQISAVYEIKGSIKTGNYIPGTRIPIKPEKDLYRNQLDFPVILNLAWHIPSEVRQNLKNNHFIGEVIDIKEMP